MTLLLIEKKKEQVVVPETLIVLHEKMPHEATRQWPTCWKLSSEKKQIWESTQEHIIVMDVFIHERGIDARLHM